MQRIRLLRGLSYNRFAGLGRRPQLSLLLQLNGTLKTSDEVRMHSVSIVNTRGRKQYESASRPIAPTSQWRIGSFLITVAVSNIDRNSRNESKR